MTERETMKMLNLALKQVLETALYALQKEQVELILRGVGGGSLVAFFLSNQNKLGAVVLLLFSLWAKKCNSKRRDR
jgi:hypothetical protein